MACEAKVAVMPFRPLSWPCTAVHSKCSARVGRRHLCRAFAWVGNKRMPRKEPHWSWGPRPLKTLHKSPLLYPMGSEPLRQIFKASGYMCWAREVGLEMPTPLWMPSGPGALPEGAAETGRASCPDATSWPYRGDHPQRPPPRLQGH